jgi:hypothetical protein
MAKSPAGSVYLGKEGWNVSRLLIATCLRTESRVSGAFRRLLHPSLARTLKVSQSPLCLLRSLLRRCHLHV